MKRILSLAIVAVVMTAACGTGSSLQSKGIQLTKVDADVTNCKLLGEVSGSKGWGYTYGSARAEMKNEAAWKWPNADVVLYHNTLTGVAGKAYDCGGRYAQPVGAMLPAPATALAPAPAPAAARNPSATPTSPPALIVGAKLFSNDGAPFGTVVLISDTSVAVSLVGGGTVTMTTEQAIRMQAKKDQVSTMPPAYSAAPTAVRASSSIENQQVEYDPTARKNFAKAFEKNYADRHVFVSISTQGYNSDVIQFESKVFDKSFQCTAISDVALHRMKTLGFVTVKCNDGHNGATTLNIK